MIKIKICGLTRLQDIEVVNECKPEFVGFVFAESRRRIDEKTAAIFRERLDMQILAIGVFVNQEVEYIAGLCNHGIIDAVQLHGNEDGEYIKRLKKICDGRIIKAVQVGDALPVLPENADFVLFDSLIGGSGKSFDWGLLCDVGRQFATGYFLAGGLNLENIKEAVKLQPFAVDVSSGVESNGRKDPEKIKEFIRRVRNEY